MSSNKIIIYISLIAIILIIAVPTILKVIDYHNEKLYDTMESKIIEKTKICFLEEKCSEDKVSLKKLYSLGYLEKIEDPVKHIYVNENSYVIKKNEKYIFVLK